MYIKYINNIFNSNELFFLFCVFWKNKMEFVNFKMANFSVKKIV